MLYNEVHALIASTEQRRFPPPIPPIPHPSPAPQTDLRPLVALIATHFNNEEIDDLAFRIGAMPDEISGATRRARARELVFYCDRMVTVDELLQTCQNLRPNVTWPGNST